MKSTPIKGIMGDVLRYDDISGREEEDDDWIDHQLPEQPPPEWPHMEPWSAKFVDDLTVGQHHYLPGTTALITTGKELGLIHADQCEDNFATVRGNAESIKMKVNDAKMQLICFSANASLQVTSYIETPCGTIESGTTMKLLGFVLGTNGGIEDHMKHLTRKVMAKS